MKSREFKSASFDDYFNEKMKDEAFRQKWEEFEPEYLAMRAVAEARIENNLSQKELSELSGINQSEISKIESGSRNPSLRILNRLAKAMGMEMKITFVPKIQ